MLSFEFFCQQLCPTNGVDDLSVGVVLKWFANDGEYPDYQFEVRVANRLHRSCKVLVCVGERGIEPRENSKL